MATKKTKTATNPRDLATPAVLHILLSLSEGKRHGYGIKDDVEERTGGALKLGPGTLYEAIHRILDAGLIDHAPAGAGEAGGRRKYYCLTKAGRNLMLEELTRLEEIVHFARTKSLLPDSGQS